MNIFWACLFLSAVAMGTSSPEVAAGIVAAVRGAGDVAIGNVYGSNIANLALIGGLCAIIRPIKVKLSTLRREIPVMLLVALLLWPILFNKYLSRPDGIMLLVLFAGLLLLIIRIALSEAGRQPTAAVQATEHIAKGSKPSAGSLATSLGYVIAGIIGLALGSDLTIRGALVIGERIGLSKAVIGMSIIAIGTSLPELVTCVVAAVKGHHDISIGNLVGSNVFNTLLVVGVAGVIRPFAIVQRLIGTDYWIMIVVSAVFIVMVAIGKRLSRTNGVILMCCYLGYLLYLFAVTAGV